jgi:type IV secretion system protein VirD4
MIRLFVWFIRAVWLAALAGFGLSRLTLGLMMTLYRWRGFSPGGALGSARFANWWELLWSGVRRGKGPIVGRKGRSFLRFNKDGMIAVFAPMGAGKGVGVVIPNLLDYEGSIVCTDIKGENSAITRRRREQLGLVRLLDTTSPETSDHFNPLDLIRTGSFHERDDAEALARLMIVPDDKSGHWDAKAEGLLACLILHVVRLQPELRNLAQVRTLSTLPPESLKELLVSISSTGPRAAAEIAASFLSMDGSEEFRSVLSNTEKATRVWTAGGPAGEISRYSDCDLGKLVRQVKTIYLVVDEEKLDIYAGFLRVMVGSVINVLTRAKNAPRPKQKVLLLLDEAAALGHLEPLERGVGYLRAYCTPLLVFQDMTQLRAIYRRAGSFLANATCKVFFNIADLEAARFVSEIIGHTTSLSRNEGTSSSNVDLFRQQYSLGLAEASRWLLDPSEVMRLPGRRSIVIYRSDILRYPVLASKVNYRSWRIRRWRGMYDVWPATPASRASPFPG